MSLCVWEGGGVHVGMWGVHVGGVGVCGCVGRCVGLYKLICLVHCLMRGMHSYCCQPPACVIWSCTQDEFIP